MNRSRRTLRAAALGLLGALAAAATHAQPAPRAAHAPLQTILNDTALPADLQDALRAGLTNRIAGPDQQRGIALYNEEWETPVLANPINDIEFDVEGNTLLTGRAVPAGNIWTAKIDINGAVVWTRTFGLAGPGASGRSVAADFDGNVYVAGSSNGKAVLLKYDRDGNLNWSRQFNPYTAAIAAADHVALDGEGNIYIAGESSDDISGTPFVARYTSSGFPLWLKLLEGALGRTVALIIDRNGDIATVRERDVDGPGGIQPASIQVLRYTYFGSLIQDVTVTATDAFHQLRPTHACLGRSNDIVILALDDTATENPPAPLPLARTRLQVVSVSAAGTVSRTPILADLGAIDFTNWSLEPGQAGGIVAASDGAITLAANRYLDLFGNDTEMYIASLNADLTERWSLTRTFTGVELQAQAVRLDRLGNPYISGGGDAGFIARHERSNGALVWEFQNTATDYFSLGIDNASGVTAAGGSGLVIRLSQPFASTPLIARTTIQHRIAEQGVWAPGSPRIDITEDIFDESWNVHLDFDPSVDFTPDIPFAPTLTYGLDTNVETVGQADVDFYAYVDGGTADISYPGEGVIAFPGPDKLYPGAPLPILLDWNYHPATSSLTSDAFPKVGMGLRADVNATLDANISASVPGDDYGPLTLIDETVSHSGSLVEIDLDWLLSLTSGY